MRQSVALVIVFGLPLLAFFGLFHAHIPDASAYTVKPTCTDSLQKRIDRAARGDTLTVRTDCIYREEVTITKPLTLDGQGEAEIRGSDIWVDWARDGGVWVSTNAVRDFYTHGVCHADIDRCLWAEQVYLNGVALLQIASGSIPTSGQFSLNAARQVMIADDPRDSLAEVTVRVHWVNLSASKSTIQGFTMKHAAVDSQGGAIQIEGVADWIVRNNTLSDAHGANVVFRDAPNGQLLNNELFNGGQVGFGGYSDNVSVQNNAIHHNNTEQFSPSWEAGGMKITRSHAITINHNHVYMNNGPGIWCDIDCTDVTIGKNSVANNAGVGIFFEISDGARIFENRVWENSWGTSARGWTYESGILISSSRNAEVYDNIVAWNGDGISIISQCRALLPDGITCDTDHRWNNVSDNYVHHNAIVMNDDPLAPYNVFSLGWVRDIEDENGESYSYMFTPQANNRGLENSYWIPRPEGSTKILFAWGDSSYEQLTDFNATPGEEGGAYMTVAERNQLLHSANMPLTSNDHTSPSPMASPLPPSSLEDNPALEVNALRASTPLALDDPTSRLRRFSKRPQHRQR
jgi:hypothetical protein